MYSVGRWSYGSVITFGAFFLHWLEVTRASGPPVPFAVFRFPAVLIVQYQRAME